MPERPDSLKRYYADNPHGSRWKGNDHPRVPWRFRNALLVIDGPGCQWPGCAWGGIFSVGQRRDVDHWHGCCNYPRVLACRRCVRGIVHGTCNTHIRMLEYMRDELIVLQVAPEVAGYLQRAPLKDVDLTSLLVPGFKHAAGTARVEVEISAWENRNED